MTWLDSMVQYAHAALGERERESLWSRGVSDAQIDSYQIGHLNKDLTSLQVSKEFWSFCKGGDTLDDVFLLPLTNILGETKGFQFRHVERGLSGYRNFFATQDEPIFFGLAQAMPSIWTTEAVWLVEGSFDLFPIQRIYPNIFATLTIGTSDRLARLLKRLGIKCVYLAYDFDTSERKACSVFSAKFSPIFQVEIPQFPAVRRGEGWCKDPAELWEAMGDATLREVLVRQVSPMEMLNA